MTFSKNLITTSLLATVAASPCSLQAEYIILIVMVKAKRRLTGDLVPLAEVSRLGDQEDLSLQSRLKKILRAKIF